MALRWMTEKNAYEFLAQHTEGRLATCNRVGEPYITPLNYFLHEGKIYFHSKLTGRKLDNLAENCKVCFEVSEVVKIVLAEDLPCACATRFISVLAFGTARVITDSAEKATLLNLLVKRFAADKPMQPVMDHQAAGCAVVEMQIEEISGKKNADPE